MQIGDRFSDRGHAAPQTYAFETAGDGDEPLEILTPDFRLARVGDDIGERAERCGMTSGTGHKRIAHAIEGRPALLWEAHTDGVGAVIDNDGSGSRFAFGNGGSSHG